MGIGDRLPESAIFLYGIVVGYVIAVLVFLLTEDTVRRQPGKKGSASATNDQKQQAYQEGQAACAGQVPEHANPYGPSATQPHHVLALFWQDGWRHAERKRVGGR